MKRTPLKRKAPLKPGKTRLKAKSKSNSRPNQDLDFRYRYLMSNPYCQIAPHLIGIVPGIRPLETASEVHHAFGSRKGRHDNMLNCVSVCRAAHRWAHDHPQEGRLLCLWIKWKAGLFDAITFKAISGKWLAGWLGGVARPSHPHLASMFDELKECAQ